MSSSNDNGGGSGNSAPVDYSESPMALIPIDTRPSVQNSNNNNNNNTAKYYRPGQEQEQEAAKSKQRNDRGVTATEIEMENMIPVTHVQSPLARVRSRRRPKRSGDEIIKARMVFKWLPTMEFSSDLLNGSWWFIWGSALSAVIPILPIVDIYYTESVFKAPPPGQSQTFFESLASWWALVGMGIFFTLGSLVFARPFYNPPLLPLYPRFFKTDEILASWMFAIASLPSIIYVASFLVTDVTSTEYWGLTVAAIIFVILSFLFLYSAYQEEIPDSTILQNILLKILGMKGWIKRHCYTDWLAALWTCFWGTAASTIGSFMYLLYEIIGGANGKETYLAGTGFVDCLIFTIGFAYFLAGSYKKW